MCVLALTVCRLCVKILIMKARISFLIDDQLKSFVSKYAKDNYTTVSQVLTSCVAELKKRDDAENTRKETESSEPGIGQSIGANLQS